MKAAVYYGQRDIRIESRAQPRRRQGEALVRVLRSGICGTDATEWVAGPKVFPVNRAHPVTGHTGPLILGHEFVGEVVEADEDSRFKPGDRVASGAGVWCGECPRCREGRTNICDSYRTLGLNVPGGMAEFVSCPVVNLQLIPDELSLDAAGLAQPLAVGIHAARRSGARDGDTVVVIGAGAIGSFVLAGLKHLHDLKVVVVDFAGPKLDRAGRLGADTLMEPGDDLVERVVEDLNGRPDVVIEASGAPGQMDLATRMVRDGGRILMVGLPKKAPIMDVHALIFREISIDTTLAHICDQDLGTALEILNSGPVAEELLERVVPLTELGTELDRLASGTAQGKVLINPGL